MTPRLTVRDISFAERCVPFVTPFRFGAVTVGEAAQLFVHVEIDVEGRGRSIGATAELLVPKWFNKDPDLSADETVDQLRRSGVLAREIYLAAGEPLTAFGLHAASAGRVVAACAKEGIPPLAAVFGPAEIDKAVLDALLRALGIDVFTGLRDNIAGLDARLTPDLDDAAIGGFLTSRKPATSVAVRHTIGMLDTAASIREAVDRHGCRYFKIKFCGEPDKDRARLVEISGLLGNLDYRASADANEQYTSLDDLRALVETLHGDPALAAMARRILYIEQPFHRDLTWKFPLGALARGLDFIIDEADDSTDAFPRARALGYRGVSSKSCKGLYKSLLNGARAAQWSKGGETFFITAEDLTCQAGLAVQQDTALVAFHGVTHAERNGHHYVDGFANTPAAEAQAFLSAHPDLYERAGDTVRLAVHDGALPIASLNAPGFASRVPPGRVGPSEHLHHLKETAS
ncbi:MAG: hypothetical protein OJF62_001042 [Pseudolabrys sp.]|jgi:hypothetical protein|nr:hypothetical protein [Pseudolabrys sp.]